MRDHRNLLAFQKADALVLTIYEGTRTFPKDEQYGLTQQLRRAAVSTASNIVEGASRHSEADFLRFLDMAQGSAREVSYQCSLARRLGYLPNDTLEQAAHEVCRILGGLLMSIRPQPQDSGPRTKD